jgi:hypothetical protein
MRFISERGKSTETTGFNSNISATVATSQFDNGATCLRIGPFTYETFKSEVGVRRTVYASIDRKIYKAGNTIFVDDRSYTTQFVFKYTPRVFSSFPYVHFFAGHQFITHVASNNSYPTFRAPGSCSAYRVMATVRAG